MMVTKCVLRCRPIRAPFPRSFLPSFLPSSNTRGGCGPPRASISAAYSLSSSYPPPVRDYLSTRTPYGTPTCCFSWAVLRSLSKLTVVDRIVFPPSLHIRGSNSSASRSTPTSISDPQAAMKYTEYVVRRKLTSVYPPGLSNGDLKQKLTTGVAHYTSSHDLDGDHQTVLGSDQESEPPLRQVPTLDNVSMRRNPSVSLEAAD
jgi:hypothetical protein